MQPGGPRAGTVAVTVELQLHSVSRPPGPITQWAICWGGEGEAMLDSQRIGLSGNYGLNLCEACNVTYRIYEVSALTESLWPASPSFK